MAKTESSKQGIVDLHGRPLIESTSMGFKITASQIPQPLREKQLRDLAKEASERFKQLRLESDLRRFYPGVWEAARPKLNNVYGPVINDITSGRGVMMSSTASNDFIKAMWLSDTMSNPYYDFDHPDPRTQVETPNPPM